MRLASKSACSFRALQLKEHGREVAPDICPRPPPWRPPKKIYAAFFYGFFFGSECFHGWRKAEFGVDFLADFAGLSGGLSTDLSS